MFDLREHRIPNWWVFGMAGLGMGLLWWLDLGQGFFWRCLLVVVLFFPLFYCRMIGAGDIKLMALICGFLGFVNGSFAILAGFLIGAAMALVKLLVQRSLIRRLNYLYAYFKRMILTKEVIAYHSPSRDGYEHTIPFGLCLFLGTLITILLV